MTRKMVSLAFFLLRLGVKLGSSLLFHYLFGSIASMLMILRAALIFGIHPSCSSFCHGGRVVGCFFFFLPATEMAPRPFKEVQNITPPQ